MFSLFKKNTPLEKPSLEKENVVIDEDNMLLIEQINWLKQNNYCTDYKIGKKNLLIVDDKEGIISSVLNDLKVLNEEHIIFDLDDYNIIALHTNMAGFNVLEVLTKAPGIEINYALLDIVLGGKKIVNGKRKMVDGVDVAIEIWKKFPTAEILFFSGCMIGYDEIPLNFKTKFDTFTNDDMNDYILSKDATFETGLNRLLEFFIGYSVN